MRASQTIEERASYDVGLRPQSTGDGSATGDFYDMQGYGRVAAFASTGQAADGTKLTVQLRQATDDEGSDEKDLGDPVEVTSDEADSVLEAMAEVNASDLDTDFTHVAVQVTTDESGLNSQAVLIRADGSYRP